MGKPEQGLEHFRGMMATATTGSRLRVVSGKTHGAVRVTSYPMDQTLVLLDTHFNPDLEAIT